MVSYKSFDEKLDTSWCNKNYQIPSYVGGKFSKPVSIKKFEVYTGIQVGYLVKKFKIQGSNDKENWEDLTDEIISETDQVSSLAYEGLTTKNTNKKYLYCRVYCIEGGGRK